MISIVSPSNDRKYLLLHLLKIPSRFSDNVAANAGNLRFSRSYFIDIISKYQLYDLWGFESIYAFIAYMYMCYLDTPHGLSPAEICPDGRGPSLVGSGGGGIRGNCAVRRGV